MNKKIIVGVGIVAIFIIIVLLLVNLKTDIHANVVNEGNIREIIIDAKMFEFSPSVIEVKEGERIRLKINSLDTEHGLSIPELGIETHDEVEFVADKKGTFDFYCHHYCGEGHSGMKGVLIVE